MTFLRFFIKYLYLGLPISSAWSVAKDLTRSQRAVDRALTRRDCDVR